MKDLPCLLRVCLIVVVTLTATILPRVACAEQETVILLHGLFRTSRSMSAMEAVLREHGFHVINVGYPSLDEPIERHADLVRDVIAECCAGGERVHFVTHSMGGIIVRYYLASADVDNLGRVVMLSPPNKGSEVIDAFDGTALFDRGAGPGAGQLATGENGLASKLGPVEFELGVITGNKTINPLFSWMIPGDDDGAVSVENAKVAGMADFIVVPYTHTFIMNAEEVHRQTVHFLRSGRFDHSASAEREASAESEPDLESDLTTAPETEIERVE